jgi:tRNA C32,U32 (ribose-2'-O)-methylase TrmJ
MFWKKKQEQPSQSQSISNVTQNGGVIQQAQAGRDLQQNQSGNLSTQQQTTNTDVVRLLENLETAIKAAAIASEQQDELMDYLRPAKREAAKEGASKELVGQNLKQVNDTLKTIKETTDAGKSLWQTGQEVFKSIAPWLGVAAKLIGM